MKTQDAERWRAQKAELGQTTDQESAQAFIAFVEDWCGEAEERVLGCALTPIEALRRSLAPIEAKHGFINTNLLANMLVVISANWEYGGDDLFESMTELEQRMVIDVAALITAEMQASAAGEAVPEDV